MAKKNKKLLEFNVRQEPSGDVRCGITVSAFQAEPDVKRRAIRSALSSVLAVMETLHLDLRTVLTQGELIGLQESMAEAREGFDFGS